MKEPKYEFAIEEGIENITPVRRKINKTMEITESFNYYDALAYCMKMEKAVKDKEAEIEGLNAMIEAYRKELVIIERELGIEELEKQYNLELHEKLKAEAVAKVAEEMSEDVKTDFIVDPEGVVSPYVEPKE